MIPVVDISEHNAPVNFVVMREAGVAAVIMRVAHGLTLDRQVDRYYQDARAAGFEHNDIGFYSFINPKRGSATETARFAAENILRIAGQDPVMYMVDIENYRDQSPNVGTQPLTGTAFARYIEDHLSVFLKTCPTTYDCGYTNRAYWNSSDGPNDIPLAQELEWIVARYPVSSPKGYALFPVPHDPQEWDTYAFTHAPEGPFPPIGGTWSAWQMSAGYNKCGPAYGAGSTDLDLNIFKDDAFQRMFPRSTPQPQPQPQPTPTPNPQPEDQMNYYVVTGASAKFIGTPAQVTWTGPGTDKMTAAVAVQIAAGNLVQVNLTGGPGAFGSTFLQGPVPVGDGEYQWTGDEFAALLPLPNAYSVDQVARDASAHANAGVDNIDRRLAATATQLTEAGQALT